jgi:hypothetical protein
MYISIQNNVLAVEMKASGKKQRNWSLGGGFGQS